MPIIEKREYKSGKIGYRAKIRVKGHPPETATFSTISAAKEWAQQTEADIRRGLYFKDHQAKKTTLAELIDKYVQEILSKKPKVAPSRVKHLRWWKDELGDYFLTDIDAQKLNEAKRKLQRTTAHRKETTLTPATVNRYLVSLSAVFSVAVQEWQMLQDNPMRLVKKLTENNERTRFLDKEELQRLLAACEEASNPMLYPVVLLTLSTGMRKSEVMHIEWRNVDFKMGVVRLLKTKNGTKRAVPLTGKAKKILEGLYKNSETQSGFVFARKDGQSPVELKKQWETAVKRAELNDFRFHDLRHSAASYLLEYGATLVELSAILGHKDMQMIKRYAHLSEQHSIKVAERMTKGVFGDDEAES